MIADIVMHELNEHLDREDREQQRNDAIDRELEWLRSEYPHATVGHMPVDCPTCGQRNVAGDHEFFVLRFVDSEIYCDACWDKEMLETAIEKADVDA